MGFYEQIAPYYEELFPVGTDQLNFIKEAAGTAPKKILDIACGTGEYSFRLASDGFNVWATDIDAEMIRQAELKARDQQIPLKLFVSDMLQLEQIVHEKFDCVFCIGNSIVHLNNTESIFQALCQMKSRLLYNGKLILQIINFDRILKKGITSLPTIVNREGKLQFQRDYSLDQDSGLIHFDTILSVNSESQLLEYKNRVDLFPITSSSLRNIFNRAGFQTVDFYGSFKKESYIPEESYLLVALATL